MARRGYLFLMLALLPLAVHNGFFDITETKTICFTVPTVVFVLVRLGFTLYRENGLPRRRLAGAEWAALALCLICFIASAAGGDFAGSFLGERGRYQGLGMMWLYAALYFAFSGARARSGDVLVPLGLGLFLSGALTVCNHLGYDVLGFCSQLGEFDRGRYISTLGNINFAGAYLIACVAGLRRGASHGKAALERDPSGDRLRHRPLGGDGGAERERGARYRRSARAAAAACKKGAGRAAAVSAAGSPEQRFSVARLPGGRL